MRAPLVHAQSSSKGNLNAEKDVVMKSWTGMKAAQAEAT